MTKQKKRALFYIVSGLLLLVLARGVYMTLHHSVYKTKHFSFSYPVEWSLRESRGSTQKYVQVHVFGRIDKAVGFGPSVSLTIYPKKEAGGLFATSQDLVDPGLAQAKTLKGYRLESDAAVVLPCHVTAREVKSSYALRLPLYKKTAQDTKIKEHTYYFEKGDYLYVLSHKNIEAGYPASDRLFKLIVKTLRFFSS